MSPRSRSCRRGRQIAAPAARRRRNCRRSTTISTATSAFAPIAPCGGRRSCPFELMFFHLGKFQKESVRIDEVNADGTRHIPYAPATSTSARTSCLPQSWGDLGFARLPRALPAERERVQGRARGVPRRELLSRARRRPALWPVGARPRDRHCRRSGRGVSAFTGSGSSSPPPDATTLTIYRAARLAARDRRLSVRHPSRR